MKKMKNFKEFLEFLKPEELKRLEKKLGNSKIELKGLKTALSSDGYYLNGNIYFEGKRTVNMLDAGIGGDVEIIPLNQENWKKLQEKLSLKEIVDMFYLLADFDGTLKHLKKLSRKNYLFVDPNNMEKLISYKTKYPLEKVLKAAKEKQDNDILFLDLKNKKLIPLNEVKVEIKTKDISI